MSLEAVVCNGFAPVSALGLGAWSLPAPGPGELLIDVHAAGVNFPDVLMVQGKYQTRPETPFVPGSEAAGVVAAVGEGVTGFAVGQRVAAFTGIGAFAEQVVVSAGQAFPIPDAIDFETAAGVLITYGTSYHALKDRAALAPGETLLVLGAAGGVGLTAVELGALMGARVIAAASSAEKLALARDRGAHELIDYSREDLRARIKELTDGRGIDVVYDPVGGDMTVATVKSLAWGGRLLVVGFAGGAIPSIPANLLLLKSAAAVGVLWGNSLRRDPAPHAVNIDQILRWIAEGALRPEIEGVYPLARVTDALEHLEARRAKGKLILKIR